MRAARARTAACAAVAGAALLLAGCGDEPVAVPRAADTGPWPWEEFSATPSATPAPTPTPDPTPTATPTIT
ncbi:endo alpha-1,4 polygalactosaminidase, partial [Jiangella anatolica]